MTAAYDTAASAELPPVDELVLKHGELVKRIAYHVVSRLPSNIEVDDLIQAGMIGLMNAAQNFTPTKGANFETYAGIRIRGAMLDEARKSNWTPRSTFKHAKQVSQAIRSIENRTGRDARSPEIADALGVSLEEYHRMVESAASSRLLSYEQLAGDPERASMLPELPEDGPEALLEGDQFREALARAVATLPERERLVLSLYYDQELNLREIGALLSVSESRVCQIHGQAVLRIRARLDEFFNDG
ncbi:MAG TPA: RNA polymerase sigma factor FliA [Gammaproteobacteria bacterium]|nr:RNA polymerase sigma factor FliA [Gammaproteobacteria bacterium]